MDADRSVLFIEVALGTIAAWMSRHDVHQETMRRARCSLPPGHLSLLNRLSARGPLRIGALALMLGIDNSTITPQIQSLERDGLIVRNPDPRDGRAALVEITQAGERLLTRLRRTRQTMLNEKLSSWPRQEREAAAAAISRLADALVQPSPTPRY